MSRIGNNPISIPEGVSVNVSSGVITVKGKNGEMNQSFDGVSFDISEDSILVKEILNLKITNLNMDYIEHLFII